MLHHALRVGQIVLGAFGGSTVSVFAIAVAPRPSSNSSVVRPTLGSLILPEMIETLQSKIYFNSEVNLGNL